MTPRHRMQPERASGAVRRAVLTSVLSALGLTSVTITAAAITLTNAEPQSQPPASALSDAPTDGQEGADLAAPVEVADAPVGIPDIALVAAEGLTLADIPTAALAAYQRAEAVLAEADESCHLDWTLVAAVGQVVTGHGTKDGGELDRRGVASPRIVGAPLKDGDDERIPDSDAGRVDGDERFDRPVGPMQLSPATWAVVGVDADDDGRRNPHDIDDASLAVSVLLCSGEDDLSSRGGRVDGVRRVNDDRTFIETVLAVDRAYRTQEAQAAEVDPVVVVPSQPPVSIPTDLPTKVPNDLTRQVATDLPTAPDPDDPSSQATDPVTWSPEPTDPTEEPTDPTETPTDPTDPPTDPTETPDPCTDPEPTDPTETPTEIPTETPLETPTDSPTDVPTETPTDDPTDEPTDLPECPVDESGDEGD